MQITPAPGTILGLNMGRSYDPSALHLTNSISSNPLSPLRPQSVAPASVRSSTSGSEGVSSAQPEAGNSTRLEPYPKPDPFVEALQHTVSLQQLCTRCIENDGLRSLYTGQLITALTELLRKARTLGALDLEEEAQQLKELRKLAFILFEFLKH